jgi:modulator of FtsH protease
MGLYDRDYSSNKANRGFQRNENYIYEEERVEGFADDDSRVRFIKRTYQLLGASMLAAAAGAYATLPIADIIHQYKWLIFGAEMLVLFFGLSMSRGKPGLNLAMLFLFTFLSGVSLVPVFASLIGAGKGAVIGNAFLSTAVLFGALSIYAIKTKRDFSNWGKGLFITMIIIFIASLINIFFLQSGMMATLISAGILLLFGIFTIYDTQNIANGAYDSEVDAAVSLYLDFLNMFMVLLGFLSGDD